MYVKIVEFGPARGFHTDRHQLFVPDNQPPNAAFGGCPLTGIPLSNGRHLGNLGMRQLEALSRRR
jgi:hypothetical protein